MGAWDSLLQGVNTGLSNYQIGQQRQLDEEERLRNDETRKLQMAIAKEAAQREKDKFKYEYGYDKASGTAAIPFHIPGSVQRAEDLQSKSVQSGIDTNTSSVKRNDAETADIVRKQKEGSLGQITRDTPFGKVSATMYNDNDTPRLPSEITAELDKKEADAKRFAQTEGAADRASKETPKEDSKLDAKKFFIYGPDGKPTGVAGSYARPYLTGAMSQYGATDATLGGKDKKYVDSLVDSVANSLLTSLDAPDTATQETYRSLIKDWILGSFGLIPKPKVEPKPVVDPNVIKDNLNKAVSVSSSNQATMGAYMGVTPTTVSKEASDAQEKIRKLQEVGTTFYKKFNELFKKPDEYVSSVSARLSNLWRELNRGSTDPKILEEINSIFQRVQESIIADRMKNR
jgi:hypothetical protein